MTDDTLLSGPLRTLKSPIARESREDDYQVAWAFFKPETGE